MNIKSFTSTQYKLYCQAPGSDYIASEFALYQILKLVNFYRPKNILEIGSGIGTIPDTILKFSMNKGYQTNYLGTENVEFCLNQIPINLGHNYKDLKIYSNLSKIPKHYKFDLIIIDGSENKLKDIEDKVSLNGIIIIEGDRKEQEILIKGIFSKSKFVHLISLKRNGAYSVMKDNDFRGGLKILFVNPNLKQNIHWSYLKINSKIKMQLRKNIYE